jgi:hypothetical protein
LANPEVGSRTSGAIELVARKVDHGERGDAPRRVRRGGKKKEDWTTEIG